MLAEILLFILLQLSLLATTGFGGPCKLIFNLTVIKTTTDPNAEIDLAGSFLISRSSYYDTNPTLKILDGSTGNYKYIEQDKGSLSDCKKGVGVYTGYNKNIWNYDDFRFENCVGDFYFATNGKDDDDNHYGNMASEQIWKFDKKFQCDGKPIVDRDCPAGGAEYNLTCINLYAIDQQFPEFKETLQTSLNNRNLNNLYQGYQSLVQRLSESGLNYAAENETCIRENDWTKHESCAANFFKPIIAVIASYGRSKINGDAEMATWLQPRFISDRKDWSSEGKWIKEMVNTMKMAFNVTEKEVDSSLFTREMIYTMLHRINPMGFPWDESPFSHYAQQWYEHAKEGDDKELRKIFSLEVDEQVRLFCKNEQTRSLLCSFMAAKNKYERTVLYLPHYKQTGIVTVSAYYAEDGLYTSFKSNLERYLQTADIKDEVNKLGKKLGGYFQTLARFDNEIAKADVGYITSAIETNSDRLTKNTEKMDELVKSIKTQQQACMVLNMIETMVKIGVAIAVTCASGGATAGEAFKAIAEGTEKIASSLVDIQNYGHSIGEVGAKTAGVNGALDNIAKKLNDNRKNIENMDKIREAVLKSGSFNSTELEVKRFLEAYNKYTPAVTKTDLAELNENYTQMLDTFATTADKAGFLCSTFIGPKLKQNIGQVKLIWASINSLLSDIHDQQFQLIDALVKVVRSKLDEMAAKMLEPDLTYYSYNFEILVRYQLALRVAAQQYCDTFQLLNNDVQDKTCLEIGSSVFLNDNTRMNIETGDKTLQGALTSYKTNRRYPFIPVTASKESTLRAINWDKLIDGEVVEFALPMDDKNFVAKYGWNAFADRDALLRSLEIFIPSNILGHANDDRMDIRFSIAAVQENVTINLKPNAQRYTIKSKYPLSTEAIYTINEYPCGGEEMDNLFVTGTKYCLEKDTGRFANNLKLSPPVSMYSKFQIQLIDGYDNDVREVLKKLRPVADTLQLRARVDVYSNPAGGKTRTRLPPKANPPLNRPCGQGKYRKIIDSKRQECAFCPDNSIPVASGSYCADKEAAEKFFQDGVQV